MNRQKLQQGARNLLLNCADLKAGERLLLVEEDPALGWYDAAAPQAVTDEALKIGAQVTRYSVKQVSNETDKTLEMLEAEHDITVFFARVGDQNRFSELPRSQRSVMCYARTAAMLASGYGCTPHQDMLALKTAVNQRMFTAKHVEIRCPLGTHYVARLPANLNADVDDVTVLRFPVGVHAPVNAAYGSGVIALADHLTTTGTHAYQPDHIRLDGVVFAHIEAGRISGFEGAAEDVRRVREHYQYVAGLFDIDPDAVHSWHAGIHEHAHYSAPDAENFEGVDNPDRWSNTVFTHPRILHFHTCGAYAPGEICWNVKDADVMLDGVLLWQAGHLCRENLS